MTTRAQTDFRQQALDHLSRAMTWTNDERVVTLIDQAVEGLDEGNPERARAALAKAMKISTGVVHASLHAAWSSAKYVEQLPRCAVCGKPFAGVNEHDVALCFEHAHLA